MLEDEIKLPQTEKIIFGGNTKDSFFVDLEIFILSKLHCAGCHDNGYATTLRSQITAGFKQKLILLRGYADMAAAINELEIPSFNIPELFIPQKLGVIPSPKQSNLTLSAVAAAIATPPPCANDGNIVSKPDVQETGLEALPFATLEAEVIVLKQHVLPPSYSSAVQAPPKRVTTPELDYSGSTASESDESEDNLRQSPTISKSKLVNPNVVRHAKLVLINHCS